MRSQRFLPHRFPIAFVVGVCLLLVFLPITAQDELYPPQFLYRDENHLILVNGYTGETTELQIELTDRDYFEWSPDGRYLLALLHEGEDFGHCLNLYDVDLEVWVYDEPIECNADVRNVVFSRDATHIAYSTNDGINGALWMYSLADETSEELYRTTDGREIDPDGISHIEWSPTEAYLTFVKYHSVSGGTFNTLVVMNSESHDYFTTHSFNSYYARYDPVWSANDDWFLLRLQEEYVTGALPRTNHQGDVYLINSETGEEYRLTYTPAVFENNVHWTPDGGIAFTVVTEQEFTFTVEEAMNVEVIPPDEMIMPEPIDPVDPYNPTGEIIVSPDADIGAWIDPILGQENQQLNIGDFYAAPRIAYFSTSIPDRNVIIGWRPSDYPYSRG